MNSPIQYDVILDTSVLINFLAIDRVDLLGQYRRYRFLITAHVRSEVTHAAQLARLEAAIEAGHLCLIEAGRHAELTTFAQSDHHIGDRRISRDRRGDQSVVAGGYRRPRSTARGCRVGRASQYLNDDPTDGRDDPGGVAYCSGSRCDQARLGSQSPLQPCPIPELCGHIASPSVSDVLSDAFHGRVAVKQRRIVGNKLHPVRFQTFRA